MGCSGAQKRSYHSGSSHPASAQESSAPSSASADTGHAGVDVAPQPEPDRPGLGTEFGEQRESVVSHTSFERQSLSPEALLALHYNSANGVEAAMRSHGADFATARGFLGGGDVTVTVVNERGSALRGGQAGGRTYVVGQDGARYSLLIRNNSAFRFEIVASVDGLDVIDGQSASPAKRGYILGPHSTLSIDGFRTTNQTVAAFRFSAVKDSYASRTTGDRNVGVIGVALFAERGSAWSPEELRRRDTADPFPGYAKPPSLAR